MQRYCNTNIVSHPKRYLVRTKIRLGFIRIEYRAASKLTWLNRTTKMVAEMGTSVKNIWMSYLLQMHYSGSGTIIAQQLVMDVFELPVPRVYFLLTIGICP